MSQRMMTTYIDVVMDVPAVGDRRFTYTCPAELALPLGAKVRVPFGRSLADGFVVGKPPVPPQIAVKSIESVYDLDFLPPAGLLNMGTVLAAHYCASIASFWSHIWPVVAPRRNLDRMLSASWRRSSDREEIQKHIDCDINKVPADLVRGSDDFRWSVYSRRIHETLSAGKGVLFLVPEVKTLSHTLSRLTAEFADDACPVHSEMTGLLRRAAWLSLARGEKRLAVGTRSAAFAPVANLGLIILDDEPSQSHKSLDWPFYDARTVALYRSLDGAKVVFGASHPSVEAMWKCMNGSWTCFQEPGDLRRENREALILDMRDTRPSKDMISEPLQHELERAFQAGKRAVLFLNRRGDSSQVSCLDCGSVIMCPRCGIPLSYHAKEGQMVCHTCGLRQQAPEVCPACGGHRWKMSGHGVEYAESEFIRKFPGVPVCRLDQDASKNAPAREMLESFGKYCPSCLIATQMVVGLRLPSPIGIVGVLSADTALSVPDFRASEKAYQVLARLGDLVAPGDGFVGSFVIQTRNPDHHAIKGIVERSAFYEEELQNRRMLGYPPFKRFFKVRFGGKTFDKVRETAHVFAGRVPSDGNVRLLGPVPAPKPKVRGQYWWQVALRGDDHESMAAMCRDVLAEISIGAVKVLIDVDPVDME